MLLEQSSYQPAVLDLLDLQLREGVWVVSQSKRVYKGKQRVKTLLGYQF